VLPKGPIVRVLLVHCSVEPWVCPCANKKARSERKEVRSVEKKQDLKDLCSKKGKSEKF
jgi:hypothetical protein